MRRIVEGFHVNDENVQKSFHEALLHVSYNETPSKTSLHTITTLLLLDTLISQFQQEYTAVKPGIYGLSFTMGKWFLTDNSATVGRILIISPVDPHKILILIKC